MTERDLLQEFKDARTLRNELKSKLEDAQNDLNEKELRLIEALTAKDATATAKYEDLGHAVLSKPKLYASYCKEDEEEVFKFLCEVGEESIIKDSVHPSSLSSVVARLIEEGQQLPECINYYLKTGLRLYN